MHFSLGFLVGWLLANHTNSSLVVRKLVIV